MHYFPKFSVGTVFRIWVLAIVAPMIFGNENLQWYPSIGNFIAVFVGYVIGHWLVTGAKFIVKL